MQQSLAVVVDPAGTIVAAVGNAFSALQLFRDAMLGRPAVESLRSWPALAGAVEEALTGTRRRVELATQGTVFAFHAEPAKEGASAGAMLIGLDMQLPLFLRRLPGVIWSTDRGLYITHAAGCLFEQNASEFVGMHIGDLAGTSEAREPTIARHLRACAGESQSFRYDLRGRCYEIKLRPLRDDDTEPPSGCVGTAVDITARRDAEQRLARSEARLAAAQRIAHTGSFEWDVTGDRLTWSDEMFSIYGLAKEQFKGTFGSYMELVHPDDRAIGQNRLLEALRTGHPFGFDHRIIRSDGRVRVLHTRGEVVPFDGAPGLVVGASLDVTDIRESTKKLERAISLLEATLEATADALLVVDRNGKVVAHNGRFAALWRIPQDLLSRRDDEALLTFVEDQLEEPEQFRQRVRDLYGSPESESFDNLRFKDGRVFERYSRPQRLCGGEIVGRVWSFRDVTERERLLRNAVFLSEATRLLASLDVETALEGVAQLSVPMVADACAVDLIADDVPRRLCAASREADRPSSTPLPRAVLDGHATRFMVGNVPCICVPMLSHGKVIGAMTFEASPHRSYDERDLELARTLAQRAALSAENARLFHAAEEAVRSRDEFLSMVAHDIRTPLTALRLAIQSLRHRAESYPEVPRALENIERQGRRLGRFIDELLDVGRIRSGHFNFDFKRVDFSAVVRDVVAEFGPDLARSRCSLTVSAEHAVVGEWDRFRLEQVVTNLLSNAIKFGLGRPIQLSLRECEGWATLTVRDHGQGIPEESRELIFKPFERAASARSPGGLGLGLYIVWTIVKGFGGSVQVESQEGRETLFTVRLPVRSAGA
jgi:PAS domain S-box-containing protein